MSETTENKKQNWLQRLKEESWEAELLISTVAIFGSLQLFNLTDWATIIAFDRLPPSQYLMGYGIVFVGLLAISILTTMFIAHFLLRAYWIGLVGLNSVFPDYSIEDSAYSEIYTRKMLNFLPKLKKTIHDVDELSSVIFSSAFFMLIMYTNMSLLVCIGLIIYNLLVDHIPHNVLMVPVGLFGIMYLLLSFIMIIANIKKFKQNERIQGWYFNAVKWSSMFFFGPLYKFILQIQMTFGSNFKKKKSLISLTLAIICIGFIITMIEFKGSKLIYLVRYEKYFDSTRTNSEFYANRNDRHDFLMTPQIESDIVEREVVQLFIPIYTYETNMFEDLCGPITDDEEAEKQWYLDCYTHYNQVFLNGAKINPTFLKYRQPKTNQFGIIGYVDLAEVPRGNNVIKVVKNMKEPLEWEIPFQWVRR